MVTPVNFVSQTPTLSGGVLSLVACGVSGADTIPLMPGIQNILIAENSDSVEHTVSLNTLPDQWGFTPTATYTVPAAAGTIPGAYMVMLQASEFGTLPVLSYDDPTTLSIALMQI